MNNSFFSRIRAMAVNVWLESVRDKLLHLLAGSGAVMMIFSVILGRMAVGGPERVIQSMGFWILGIWGLMAVIYLGSNILKREFQNKTVYLVLSRPVSRPTFLIGKFTGMILVLSSVFIFLSLFWLMILQLKGIAITLQHFQALLFILAEWILLAAFSLFFASFTSPILHNFFLVSITFLGHWSNDLRLLAEKGGLSLWITGLLKGLYLILPNMAALNFREEAIYNLGIPFDILRSAGVVWFCWTATILIAANLIFLRRRLV